MKKRYTYKLRPGAQAVARLRAEHVRNRWLWNECVHQFRTRQKPTTAKLDKLLTKARSEMAWLREGSSVVQQQTIRDYGRALNDSFKVNGRGRPKIKRRKTDRHVSLNYTLRGFSRSKDGTLRLAGGISVPVVWSRELPSEPSSVRVYEDAAGWWWASFVVEVEEKGGSKPHPFEDDAIGIDWGIKITATTTDDTYDLSYRAVAARHAKAIARQQRRMALHKQQRDDAERRAYARARRRKARAERRARWQRQEHARRWAQTVAYDHGRIAVEDFKPKFLAKSRMSRKMHDSAIGQLKRELAVAAKKSGSELVLVSPAYTTMTCSNPTCGARAKQRIPLHERTFRCHQCGHSEDRDRNAAKVVLSQAGFNLALHDGRKPETASVASAP